MPALLFVALHLTISLSSMAHKSPVMDEGVHIAAGYTSLRLGDFRMNPEHPPLVKLLAAVPLLFPAARIELSDPTWQSGDQWAFAYNFFYRWNDAHRVLFRARVPMVLLSTLLGLAVGACAASLFGRAAGWTALGLYLVNPDLLAHGQLVTTDLAVSGFMFLAVWAGSRALQSLTPRTLLLTGAATGVALVAKFSGVLILPMLMLVGIGYALRGGPVRIGLRAGGKGLWIRSVWGKLLAAGAVIAAAMLLGLAVIWAVYGFRYHASPDPEVWRRFETEIARITGREEYRRRLGPLLDVPRLAGQAKLLPEAYLYGFLYVVRYAPKRAAFLLGEVSEQSRWYYFMVTFLVKTPLPLIMLIGLGLGLRRKWRSDGPGLLLLGLPVLCYWGVALLQPLNIGHRHLLPIYPFLIVIASRSARVWERPRRRWVVAIWLALAAWSMMAAARIYPDYLAYFNELAGGPAGGYRWLVDSNLDWGQDLPGLAAYQREHRGEELYLHYFGFGDPGSYGVRARSLREELRRTGGELPRGTLVAVSATRLQCLLQDDREDALVRSLMEQLRGREPVGRVGNSILIYRLGGSGQRSAISRSRLPEHLA